jgi:glycerophosphoryl diester phosphodiesterase
LGPLKIAHRGAMSEAPENTRPAFNKAISYCVDGIEFDVQMTGDGIPVIYHDESLVKITGRVKTISDFTFKVLSGYDWGGWFSKDFAGTKILTLEEVLSTYGEKTRLFIEIKPAPDKKYQHLYSRLSALATEYIRDMIPRERIENMFILSFDPEIIKTAYLNDPELNYVLNLETASIPNESLNIDTGILYGYCLEYDILTRQFVENSHHYGKKVLTYSCNTIEAIQHALVLDVDGIMTDDPGGSAWEHFQE